MTDDDLKYMTPGDMKQIIVDGLRERLKQQPIDKTAAAKALREYTAQVTADFNEHNPFGVKITDIRGTPDGQEIVTISVPFWWLEQRVTVGE